MPGYARPYLKPYDPPLLEAAPTVYGALGGLMGTAPDEFNVQGSVLDEKTAKKKKAVKDGADVTYPLSIAAQAAPVLGGLLKLAGAGPKVGAALENYMAKSGMRLNAAPESKSVGLIPGFTAEEVAAADLQDQVLGKFGKKAAAEAKLAKKVAAQDAAAASAVEDATPKVKGTRSAKVSPDTFRKMEDMLGSDATLAEIKKGAHIKPGYVGAPRTVNSPQALGAMRASLDGQFADGANAIQWADPERVGNWYDRAKAAQAITNEPWQLPGSLNQHAVYSAGVSPESELMFSLKHSNSRGLGEPVMAYRGAGMRKLDDAVANDQLPEFGFKIGEYRNKNDPMLPNTGLFGVNDFRAAQGFGYTTPDGKIWKGGVSATMHPFMDGETALIGARANAAGVGGRTNWQGPHIQEVPWVYGKGQDLFRRGENGRFAGDRAEGVRGALQEANNTIADYMYKHAASATHEAIPGANTGHVPSLLNASPEEKLAYSAEGAWDIPSAYQVKGHPEIGAGTRDALYSAHGFRQLPAIDSTGFYVNQAGVLESNPLKISRPLLDMATGGGLNPNTVQAMNATERLRAAVDAQEAYGWSLPDTMDKVGRNGLVLDSRNTRSAFDPFTGTQPTAQQLDDIQALLPEGFGVSANSRGAVVFPFDKDSKALAKQSAALNDNFGPLLQEIFPSTVKRAVFSQSNVGYGPGIGRWGENGIEATAPFSGEATSGLLQTMADAPPGVARNLSESEPVRDIIRQKIARDEALPGARRDIQNMRNFLAEADWNKAVEMIRSGMKPAAAVAALGYSLDSMAADGFPRD